MGRKYEQPDPLDAARRGDEDALEQVLGSVCAPLFDLALHVFRHPVTAELTTVAALRGLADDVRANRLDTTPVAAAARHLLAAVVPTPPPPTASTPLQRLLDELPEPERRAVLCAFSCDLEEDELAAALGVDGDAARVCYFHGLERLGVSAEVLRDGLDAVAGEVRLPAGLTDRALGQINPNPS